MRCIRLKAALHISNHFKNLDPVPPDATFDYSVVDFSGITESGKYYVDMLFVPRTEVHFMMHCRLTTASDGAHCQDVGPQSYGTIFEVVRSDANNHFLPLFFSH